MTKKGFTLIEILIVIVLIGILTVIFYIGNKTSVSNAEVTKNKANVKTTQSALTMYMLEQKKMPKSENYVPTTDEKDWLLKKLNELGSPDASKSYEEILPHIYRIDKQAFQLYNRVSSDELNQFFIVDETSSYLPGYLVSKEAMKLHNMEYIFSAPHDIFQENVETNQKPIFSFPDIKKMVTGGHHTVVLTRKGTVWAWGNNAAGQLGDGSTTSRETPIQVKGENGVGLLTNIKDIFAGYRHTIAIDYNNDLWAWGDNSFGQLGDGTTNNCSTPYPLQKSINKNYFQNVKYMSLGFYHSFAIKNDGTILGWGENDYGQLGIGTTSPKENPKELTPTIVIKSDGQPLKNPKQLHTGGYHSLFIDENGVLWVWGSNIYKQLGLRGAPNQNKAYQIPALINIKEVSAGFRQSIIVNTSNKIYVFGTNNYGQLGTGDLIDKDIPTEIKINNTSNLVQHVYAAGWQSYIVLQNGEVYASGYNAYGQLGDGTKVNKTVFSPVSLLNQVDSLYTGYSHVFAKQKDGTFYRWGENKHFQMGNGNDADVISPQKAS